MAGAPSSDESLTVAWSDLVRFVRQLSHDIRNNLNAVELQSAYIAELTEEPELKSEVKRLREMASEIGTNLQRLTAALGQITPTFISYNAADFVEDLKQKLAKDFPDDFQKVVWDVQVGNAVLNADPQLLEQAFVELFTNAFRHERNVKSIKAKVSIENDRFVFALQEPKARFELSTDKWGHEPLRNVNQGRYGLGLNRMRIILETHDGNLEARFDRASSVLATTITLPLFHEETRR